MEVLIKYDTRVVLPGNAAHSLLGDFRWSVGQTLLHMPLTTAAHCVYVIFVGVFVKYVQTYGTHSFSVVFVGVLVKYYLSMPLTAADDCCPLTFV